MSIKPIETVYRGHRFRSSERPTEPQKRISARANLEGAKFGRLSVEQCLGVAKGGYRWWGCVCECGGRIAAKSREIRRGHTQSCGCLQREIRASKGGQNKLPAGHASRNELLASYKKSARERGHEWALSDNEAFALLSGDCVYCGTPPNKERRPNKGVNGGFWYTGIDRLNSGRGYTSGNTVSCCWDCNRAKGSMSVDAFESWLDRIYAARQARFEHGQVGAPHEWQR